MKVNDIVHKHISITINNPINLDIFPSEIIGIIGKNGSGKSSLLDIFINKILPDEGAITNYCSLSFLRSYFLLKNNLKISHQINLFTTNYQNFPWPDFLAKKYGDLSDGEKRVISLWIHLQIPAEIYIMDEPFIFLDDKNKNYIKSLLNKKLTEKKSIIISHQYTEELSDLKNLKIISL